ncbi:MAG: C25 family cysteine peptidase, partial [Saprospiraceae bacterium]
MKNYTVAFFTLWINFCIGQEMTSLKGTLNWKNITSNSTKLNFEGAQYCPQKLGIPILLLQAPINKNAIVNVELRNITTEEITDAPKNYRISEDFKINHGIYTENRQGKIWIEIEALRNNKGRIEKLIDYEIIIQEKQNNLAFSPPPPPFKLTSILSNGDIYKIAVKENGIYKIDKNFLEKNLKLNLSGIDPRKISIYGNGGDKLPELNATNRIDDLEELAIYISGENDGSFDANDQILFYANGPDLLTYNLATQDFDFTKNIYSEWSYYFIKINTQNGKRISQKNKITGSFPLSNKSLQCIHYEKDLVNLLEYNTCNHGTGQRWAGESIGITRPFESMDLFRFPNIVMGSDIKLTGYYVARAGGNSLLDISLNSSGMQKTVYGVDLDICTNPTASGVDFSLSSKATAELVSVKLQPKISSSISHESWIDFIQVSATTLNNFSKNIFQIFDPNTAINPINSYEIDLANKDVNVWDITDFHQVKSIATDFENGKIKFNDQSQNQIKKYWIFNPLLEIKSPEYISKIENQNLHSIQDLELLIVYYSEFKEEAFRLKKHREDFSKLKVEAIEISTIYNEFASGTQDPTALRDFCRMIYSRSPNFKYLLLVGDASYDYRHLDKKVNNENLVPTYQTMESFDPILGFPSDDYFGLLDDSEGNNLDGFLDISIG